MSEFERAQAECDAAKRERDEAERRYRAAAQALFDAQCRVAFGVEVDQRRGYVTEMQCTLERGHAGAHRN